MTLRLRSPSSPGTVAILAICCLIGLLAGVEPKLALVGAVGLVFALIIFVNFTVGLSLFAFVSFLEVLDLGSSASVGKLAGGMVIAGWIAAISTRDKESTFFEDHPSISLLLGLFLAWIVLGMTWAESPSEVGTALTRYIPNVMLIPIVYTAVRDRRGAMIVMTGLILGALAACVYGLAHPAADEARLNGTALDPNELASILVACVSLSAALLVNAKGRPGLRLAALSCVGLCVLGIFLTVSRGGLIALAVSLVAGMILGGRWRHVAFSAALLIASASFFYFAVLAPPAARERITSTNQGETQLKEGRTTIWEVAERVVESKPLVGIGANNFQTSARHYLLTQPGALGRTDLIIATPKVVHNTYLGMAAELGLIGLGMFVVIVLFCVRSALRAARYFAALGDRGGEALSRGLAVGLIGTLVADVFISQEYSKPLWLLLGLCPAMLGIAVRQTKAAAERRNELAS